MALPYEMIAMHKQKAKVNVIFDMYVYELCKSVVGEKTETFASFSTFHRENVK